MTILDSVTDLVEIMWVTSTNDAGPGSTNPEEQLSHGHDSSNMSGHAIPAMLYGNQYPVLFDAEPTEDEILHGG